MTRAELLAENAVTAAFLARHRQRHERTCGCRLGRREDGTWCPPGLALLELVREEDERRARLERERAA